METKIIIAGSGGQGILFLGKVIASAGMIEDKKVTWFPSYGAEIRGGTANCTVIISDEMIGSPVVLTPDMLIVMNMASMTRFLPSLKKGGLLLYDSSLVKGSIKRKDISVVALPSTSVAGSVGYPKSANMMLLGALIAKTGLISLDSVKRVVGVSADPKKAAASVANIDLIRKGMEFIEDS